MFDDATTRLLRGAASLLPVTSPIVTVVVVEGANAGLRVVFEDLAHRQIFVGKGATCEVRLEDETVSRRHLALRLNERGVLLEDLESSNGTSVNGVVVERVVLTGGELIRLGTSALRIEVGAERQVLAASDAMQFGGFVGASASARRLYLVLARLTHLDTPVLIEGEAGVGKALIAESLHETGPRAAGPFVVLEGGHATPAEVERALFGHVGDNGVARPGLLERASGGTLYIGEIGDLESPTQLKLLRALEARTARRLNDTTSYDFDVRFIAATRRNLDRDVHARRFREELLAFLAPGRIEVPPLRSRRSDIGLLMKVFWTRFGGNPALLSPALVQRFEEYNWPGNVRELTAAVARQVVDADQAPTLGTMPPPPGAPAAPDSEETAKDDSLYGVLQRALPYAAARQHIEKEFESRYLAHMLKLHGGNATKAAAAAGISRRHFYRLKARG